ncbi:MAG: carboxypeptidase-like regulatory domain-containing protein [Acidobacteriota bacterium]
MRNGAFIATIALVGAAAVAGPPPVTDCVVTGRLRALGTHAPLEGEVIAYELEDGDAFDARRVARDYVRQPVAKAASGPDGQFQLDLPAGKHTYHLEAAARGHVRTFVRDVPATPGKRWIEMSLSPGAPVAGRVIARGGGPVPGALISSGIETVVADAKGSFRFEGLPMGKNELVVRAPGLATQRVDVAARSTFEVLMEPGNALTGTLRDQYKRPIAGALVEILEDPGGVLVRSDANGRFEVPDLLGVVTVMARSGRHRPATWAGTVPLARGTLPPAITLQSF